MTREEKISNVAKKITIILSNRFGIKFDAQYSEIKLAIKIGYILLISERKSNYHYSKLIKNDILDCIDDDDQLLFLAYLISDDISDEYNYFSKIRGAYDNS